MRRWLHGCIVLLATGLAPLSACVATVQRTGGRLGVSYSESCREPGILITSVEEGSAAASAGIVKGDRLLAFDGIRLGPGGVSMLHALDSRSPGQRVVVTI